MKTPPPATASLGPQTEAVPQLIAATAHTLPEQVNALARARAFAEPLMAGETLDSGENTLAHADGDAIPNGYARTHRHTDAGGGSGASTL